MKTIYLIIITLFVGFFAKAQQSVLVSHTWNLEKITLNNIDHPFPNLPVAGNLPHPTGSFVFFNDNFFSGICNSMGGNISYSNNQIAITASGLTLGSCPSGYDNYENLYFGVFFGGMVGNGNYYSNYGYLIEPIGNTLKLTLTNPIGVTAVYWASNLSASNLSLSDFKIYPNPVKSVLNISAKLPELNVQLFDMPGKLILSKNIKRTSASDLLKLDMNSIKKGNYILTINNPNGELIHTSKIIKD